VTVYVFADPLREAIDYLETKAAEYPAGTVVDAWFPTTLAAGMFHVQVAWDGTPGARQQAEAATIRVTAWGAKGSGGETNALASLVRKHLLEFASASVWRVLPGTGRTPGIDPDTGLPFCTFTVSADIRPA